MKKLFTIPATAKPLVRIWPFFVSLLLSGLILTGFIVRNETVVGEDPGMAGISAPIAVQGAEATTRQKIDDSKPWTYTFDAAKSTSLDYTLWTVENGNLTADYNGESQTYTTRTENVRIEGNELIIQARAESMNGKNYTSARINTKDSFAFTYGTLEVEMKLPKGTGTWPAAWLMPNNDRYDAAALGVKNTPNAWALNGEIDFMEAVGYIPGEVIPAVHNYNSMHSGTTYTPGYVKNADSQYHRYGVIKTPTSISFTIDGKIYATREKTSNSVYDWPYDQPYYLILNLAMGGTWGGEKGIDEAGFEGWKMHVRSISYKPLS